MSFSGRFRWTTLALGKPTLVRQRSEGASTGDKIFLPPEALEPLSAPGINMPMSFELRCPEKGTKTFVGVLEFSAPPGCVLLTETVRDALGLDAATDMDLEVALKLVDLPKGTFVKLQPLTADFLDLPAPKPMFERLLRTKYTSLTTGDVLTLYHDVGGETRAYEVLVTEHRPETAPAISVLNTDLTVEFEAPTNMKSGAGRQPTQSLAIGETKDATVGPDVPLTFRVALPAAALAGQLDVIVTVTAKSGDPDLYVAMHPVDHPSIRNHLWAANTPGNDVLVLPAAELVGKASPLYASVVGYRAAATFSVNVSHAAAAAPVVPAEPAAGSGSAAGAPEAPDAAAAPPAPATAPAPAPADSTQCPTCGQFIPSLHFDRHTAFCARHNKLCDHPGCGMVLRASEAANHCHCPHCDVAPMHADDLPKHVDLYHTPIKCRCGVSLELEALQVHVATTCPKRMHVCRFCGDTVAAGDLPTDGLDRLNGLTGHESFCGSRTARCGICSKAVQLKRMDEHNVVYHGGVDVDVPPSPMADPGDEPPRAPWNCPDCTFENPGTAGICGVCGAGDPAGPPPEAAAAEAPSSSDAGGDDTWYCARCTFIVPATEPVCPMCMSARPGFEDIAAALRPAVRPKCRNAVCAANASTDGDAAALSLCDRCFILIGKEYENKDGRLKGLFQRYVGQLSCGCGSDTCPNPYCKYGGARGLVTSTSAAAAALKLMPLASGVDPTYFVCVTTNRKLSVAAPVSIELAPGADGGGEDAAGAGASAAADPPVGGTPAPAKRTKTSDRVASAFFE